jgi:hypothetical protein
MTFPDSVGQILLIAMTFSDSVDQNLVIAMTISGSVEQNLINDDFSRSASAAKQEARDRSRASCLLHLVPKGGLEPPRF